MQVGIDKARTAAIYRRPSKDFEDQVKNGRVSALALAGSVPLQGGLPIKVDGVVVGAISASGNTPQEDEDIAAAGLAALEAPQDARYFPAASVDTAFSKGVPIFETSSFKVHASRRDNPGSAEVHLYETDVIYVLNGSSTFIVGGTMTEPKETAFGEIRGKSISGGQLCAEAWRRHSRAPAHPALVQGSDGAVPLLHRQADFKVTSASLAHARLGAG